MAFVPPDDAAPYEVVETDEPPEEREDVAERIRAELDVVGGPIPTPLFAPLMQAAARERTRISLDLDHENAKAPRWRSLGPANATKLQMDFVSIPAVDAGRVRKVLPNPRDPASIYLLAAGGGLWRLDGFGTTAAEWYPLTDFVGSTSGGSFAIARDGRVYLGAGDPFDVGVGGFMVHSMRTDEDWSEPVVLPGVTSVLDVALDEQKPEVVLVGTNAGLFRSTDRGDSFTAVAQAQLGASQVWSLVRTSAGWIAATERSDDSSGGALYVSRDRGATWEPVPGPISGAGRMTLAVGAPRDAIVYALAANQGNTTQLDVFRSADGGLHWEALGLAGKTPTNPTLFQGSLNVLASQAWYNQLLLVDPDDATRRTVFIGGQFAAARTRDGGETWTVVTDWLGNVFGQPVPYVHADLHSAAVAHTRDGPVLLFGSDGGLFTSRDGGDTWSDAANVGLATQQLYAVAGSSAHPEQLLVGTQDVGVRSRVGTTKTWDQVVGSDGVGVAWEACDDRNAIAAQPYGNMYSALSTPADDASKWEYAYMYWVRADAHFYTAPFAAFTVQECRSNVFFFATWRSVWFIRPALHRYYRIGTAGVNGIDADVYFRQVPHPIGLDAVDGTRIGIVANGGRVALSTDPSSSDFFVQRLSELVPGFQAGGTSSITWANYDTIYVSSVHPDPAAVHVVKSTDDGLTWTAAEGGLPSVPVDIVRGDIRDPTGQTAYAGTWIGVYRTVDGGAHWTPFGRGLPQVRVRDLQITRDGKLLRAATYGRGLWEVALP